MATLNIVTLFCLKTEDLGDDEAYLVVNGNLLCGPRKMRVGQTWFINKQVKFTNSLEIKLFDRDSGAFDSDDYLGTITVTSALKDQGEQIGSFRKDGANYNLYYNVV
jgi:hypothetical protein